MTKKDIVTELKPLFYPRAVSIVGASKSLLKIGSMTLMSIVVGQFEGGISGQSKRWKNPWVKNLH